MCQKPEAAIGKPFSITGNALNRDFTADKPMQKLTTDITYLPFGLNDYIFIFHWLHIGLLAYTIGSKQILSLYWILLKSLTYLRMFYYSDQAAFILPLNTTIYVKKRRYPQYVHVKGLLCANQLPFFAKCEKLST